MNISRKMKLRCFHGVVLLAAWGCAVACLAQTAPDVAFPPELAQKINEWGTSSDANMLFDMRKELASWEFATKTPRPEWHETLRKKAEAARDSRRQQLAQRQNLEANYYGLGELETFLGNPEAGFAYCQQGLKEFPQSAALWRRAAEYYEEAGQFEKALEATNKLLEITKNPFHYLRRAVLYSILGQKQKTIEDLNQFIASKPVDKNMAIAYASLSLTHFSLGNTQQGIDAIDMAIKHDPSPSYYATRAQLLQLCGRFQEAMSAVTTAIGLFEAEPLKSTDLDQEDITTMYFRRAFLFVCENRPDVAVKDIERIHAHLTHEFEFSMAALIYSMQSDYPKALQCLNRIIAGNAEIEDQNVFFERLDLLEATGAFREGLAETERLLKEGTLDKAELLLAKTTFQLHLGQLKEAEATVAIMAKDYSYATCTTVAKIRLALYQKNPAEAIRLAQEYIDALREPDAIWYVYQAEALRMQNDQTGAARLYKQAMERVEKDKISYYRALVQNYLSARLNAPAANAPAVKLAPLHGLGATYRYGE